MQKFTDTGNLPTKPVPASMQEKSMATYESVKPLEGMSSLRGHVGSLASMPSKLMGLLFLMLLITACHSHRQTIETIALSQRNEQKTLQIHDTTWQSVHLLLNGIVTQYYSNMKDLVNGDTSLRMNGTISAELTLDKQTKTETTVLTEVKDTLIIKQLEKNKKLFLGSDATKKSHSFPVFWAVIACIAVFVLMFLMVKLKG